MAEKEDKTDSPEKEPPKAAPAAKRGKLWSKLANRRTLGAVLAVSVIAHGVGFIYYNKLRQIIVQSPEVGLGEFGFESADTRLSAVMQASFSLHVSLLTDIEPKARARLYARRFRVQQDIEQLLRKSQGGDFEDHELAELKRQIQEQINTTLDMRAIEQVIITDLEVVRADKNGPQPPTVEAKAPDGQVGHGAATPPAVAGNQPNRGAAGSSPWETSPPQ
jgi:flagellar basal body-associated protein FliL